MKRYSLNGQWICISDVQNKGIEKEWFFQEKLNEVRNKIIPIEIPKSFNLIKKYHLFEGVFWHFREFELNDIRDTSTYDYHLQFKGVNYNTKVWLNGIFVGKHDGGFTPFKFLVNGFLKAGSNFLAVRVDNSRQKDGIPSLFFDWFNWGGIYRDVDLFILEKGRIESVKITTKLITRQKARVDISYKKIGKGHYRWEILDIEENTIVKKGGIPSTAENFKISFENPKLWSPETPSLYQFQIFDISLESSNLLYKTNFGIRQIEINSSYILLNKKRVKLKGLSLHEEYLPYGRTIPYEKRREDLKRIKALGFNSVRTAHYPHDESLIEIADKLGILILEEIPVYRDCSYKNRETFKLAARMMRELIMRDYNHPSVIWWSVGNEIPTHKRVCSQFIKNLMDFVRMFDSTRIVTYVSSKLSSDLFRRNADLATLNSYFGWYYGGVKMLNLVLDWIRTPVQNKPWIFTEFGAGAKYGFRNKGKYPQKFSEDFQYNLIDYTIRTINSKDYFSGWFIWIFRDFKSLQRSNEYQQGFNRKGIVSEKSFDEKLIFNYLPNILNKKRRNINTKYLGIILWIIFFPFSHFIATHIINLFLKLAEIIPYKIGLRRLSQDS
jgi:beta-glucuronidase